MYSIRRRLTLILAGGFAALILGAGFYVAGSVREYVEEEFDALLRAKAQALTLLTDQEDGYIEFDYAPEDWPEFEREKNPYYFQFWLLDGTPSPTGRSARLDEDLPFVPYLDGGADVPERGGLFTEPRDLVLPDGRAGRIVQVAYNPKVERAEVPDKFDVPDENDMVLVKNDDPDLPIIAPTLALAVARGREGLDQLVAKMQLATLGVAGLVILLSVIFVWRALAFGFRPIETIASQVEKLDADSLSLRLGLPRTPAELAPIVDQLNGLLGRLDDSFQRERRFAGNVAHELRTPIAELRSLAAVGGQWPEDKKSVAQFFADVKDIAGRMEGVIVDLLLLARCQAGIEQVVSFPTNLRELITSTWVKLASSANKAGLRFHVDLTQEVVLESDPGKLAIILGNLLGNAVEYAVPKTDIRVSGGRNGSDFHLEIANSANPLSPDDLPKLAEPFWRKDDAGSSQEHAGLGLSLVTALATLLRLEVGFTQDDGTFRVRVSGQAVDASQPSTEPLRHLGS